MVGTFALLEPQEKQLVRSFAVNRFRGDLKFFERGRLMLEERVDRKCVGVFPYQDDVWLDPEDSVSLDTASWPGSSEKQLRIVIVRLPHISNFTDFRWLSGARYISKPVSGDVDCIILPGSKNTIADLRWLRETGLYTRILDCYGRGVHVWGICGGYQMLGLSVSDPEGVESAEATAAGLGLLPIETRMLPEKTTRVVEGRLATNNLPFRAYKIHMGKTVPNAGSAPFAFVDGKPEGHERDRLLGTYLHGAFEDPEVLRSLLAHVAQRRSKRPPISPRRSPRTSTTTAWLIGLSSTRTWIFSWNCIFSSYRVKFVPRVTNSMERGPAGDHPPEQLTGAAYAVANDWCHMGSFPSRDGTGAAHVRCPALVDSFPDGCPPGSRVARACPNRAVHHWTACLRVREKTGDCRKPRAQAPRFINDLREAQGLYPGFFHRPLRTRLGSFPSLLWLTVIAGFAVTFGSLRAAEPSPQRIVSSAPSITEMLYALGLGDRVVGVTTFCHYPPEVLNKPKIGTYINPNFEVILAKKPDLVIVLKEHRGLGTKLKNFGLPVLALQHNTLEEIYESMLTLGERTGAEQAAQQRIAAMRKQLDEIGALAAPLPKRSVMFVVGRTSATVRDLVVVGRNSFLNELISIAGGTNCFEDAPAYYPRIPREEVYARGPQVIIDMGDMGDTQQVSEEHRRSIVEIWKSQPMLPAVQAGRVYPVAEDFFVVPGPRVVEATRSLLAMIHPEVVP